jgi:hypothetical protein
MTIDQRRRNLSIGMAVAACGASLPAWATTTKSTIAPYRHRLRFHKNGSKFDFWVRVSKVDDIAADVPFILVISSDAAGQVVLKSIAHVSRADSAHIARGAIDLQPAGWSFGTPLFCHVIYGNGGVSSKVRRLGRPPNVQRA